MIDGGQRRNRRLPALRYCNPGGGQSRQTSRSPQKNPRPPIRREVGGGVCLLLAACGNGVSPSVPQNVPAETSVTFTDDLNRQVTVDRPQRVACLISSFSDIWCLAGGADAIVAATDATWRYFDLPLRDDVVNLGNTKELDLERLLACEPDLILASGGTDRNVALEASFSAMGLNAAYFSVDTFEDYLRMLKICTEITGKTENYDLYGTQVARQVEAALARQDGSAPSVLYVRATGSS